MFSVLQSMPTRGKFILGASVLVGLIAMFLLFRMATAPSYVTVVSGVQPGDTAKSTAALDEAGISYKLENNGTAVAVVSDSVSQAKVALGSAGIDMGGTSQPGYELLDNSKLGSSDFQQKINYQRALEGEVAKTLMNINGISGATVQLSLPEDKLFSDNSKPATAAVVLTTDANGLDPQQVKGIAGIVAGSVEGLKDENVTITSATTGELMWPLGDGADGGGGATVKLAAENRYASQLEAKVNGLLIRTLGPNKAYVQAQPTLNVDDVSREELRYGPKSMAINQKTEKETLKSTGDDGGAAGARANIQGATAQGGNTSSDYNRSSTEENFGVDKTIQKTKVAPGTVEKLDVALVLDASLPQATVSQLQAAVASAVGLDRQRGDTLAVSQVAFAKLPNTTPKKGPVPQTAMGAAKWIGIGIGTILFLFFVTRALRKRENEALGDARWLTEIDEPRPLAALTAGDGAVAPTSVLPETAPASAARQQIGEMVDKEPEKVAQQIRGWMAEDQ